MIRPFVPIKLETIYQPRIWGGFRLGDGSAPVGEAWVVFEDSRVATVPWRDRTLGELSAETGEWLLGSRSVKCTGCRFPLLIKLLDAHDWLSVQVHPDDEQARKLVGPHEFGKTEAWHFLDVTPGGEIILGLRPEINRQKFKAAVYEGRPLDVIQRRTVAAGDSCLIPAGTVHALGPGLFLYEVQQTSDTTYRVYDWDRPLTAGRDLHLEQAVTVVAPDQQIELVSCSTASEGTGKSPERLVECDYFCLNRIHLPAGKSINLHTERCSFHALTVVEGDVDVRTRDGDAELAQYETAIVPAAANAYQLTAGQRSTVLLAYVG